MSYKRGKFGKCDCHDLRRCESMGFRDILLKVQTEQQDQASKG